MIDEKKLIAEIREKIRPESFGEQCNSLDVIYAMLQLIDKQPRVEEWIPCSERLPEEKEPVLVQWEKYDRHLNITITYLDVMWLDDAEEEVFETINGMPNGKVVAWQPLPEPWEGKE